MDDDGYDENELNELEELGMEEEAQDIEVNPDLKQDMKPELRKLYQQHPECNMDYVEQVYPKIDLVSVGNGGDKHHKTYPFLTQFERTKIIGLRANQLSKGAVPFVNVPKHVTDVRDIARLELEQRRIPFIVKRPLPDGTAEYWRLSDLLLLQ